ncbi:MAG: hypothetical protein IT293_01710 [Deltaproteobacteria bacterium]|nr:hypothetical protein [Deltaproteobacteria bacterium]
MKALLSPREFRELVAGIREADIVLDRVPRYVRCYRANDRLHIVRVHPLRWHDRDDALQRALGLLQDLVASDGFAPWWHLARHELLTIVYLLDDAVQAEEFGRWTTRHPIVSRLGGAPIRIPVLPRAVPTIFRPTKDKSPEGLLSRYDTD